MTDSISRCPDKESLVALLYDEHEGGGEARRAMTAHVEACDACRDELAGLQRVRARLADWEIPSPALPLGSFELPEPTGARERRPLVTRAGFMAAAAALLVLGMAAGLANLEIRVGESGLVVRTGWARASSPSAAPDNNAAPSNGAPSLPDIAGAPGLQAPGTPSSPSTGAPGTASGSVGAPWRADLAVLEQQLRQEFQPVRAGASPPLPASRGTRGLDPETVRQIQALIDESEVRQQRNLALRIAEVSRDFDLQRKADLVQIQQGLGRLEGRTDAEAARTRELVNYMMRVSQQQAPPR